MASAIEVGIDLAIVAFVAFGTFFMLVGALGLVRLPDIYHRMHAATKGVTLGVVSMVVAGVLAISHEGLAPGFRITTTFALVIVFQFVANPVGAHMLAKAAHLDRCRLWSGTLSDELERAPGAGPNAEPKRPS